MRLLRRFLICNHSCTLVRGVSSLIKCNAKGSFKQGLPCAAFFSERIFFTHVKILHMNMKLSFSVVVCHVSCCIHTRDTVFGILLWYILEQWEALNWAGYSRPAPISNCVEERKSNLFEILVASLPSLPQALTLSRTEVLLVMLLPT